MILVYELILFINNSELSIQGAEHHDSLVQKVEDIEKWKENTAKVLSELSTRYP